MKRSSWANLVVTLFLILMFSVSTVFGASPAKPPAASPKAASIKCTRTPDAQVVNNTGVKIHQVKVGNVVFQENLSACTDGCSTGFKAVNKGQNQVAVKINSTSAWVNLGSLGKFEECTHYAVNLIKKDKKLCAELFTRKNTDPTFNNDPTKQKAGETCQSFPTLTGPMKPAMAAAPPRAQAGAKAPGSSPTATMPQTPGQMQMSLPKPVIENMHFEQATTEPGDPMTMSAGRPPGMGAGSSSESVPTIRAKFGDRLFFDCAFRAKNVDVDTLKINFIFEGSSNSPGKTPSDLPGGWKYYRFQYQHIAERDGLLTMRVIAIGSGGAVQAEKQVRLEIRMPVLELRNPEFNDDTREVTFRVKNAGDMTFPGSGDLVLDLIIKGLPQNEQIGSWRVQKRDILINRDHIVPIGTYSGFFPEFARKYNQIVMYAKLLPSCNGQPLPSSSYQFSHTFPARTTIIENAVVQNFSFVERLFDGYIRINTFKDPGGSRSDTQPYVANDSHFSLTSVLPDPVDPDNESFQATVTRPIVVEWFRFGSDGAEAYVYIDRLIGSMGGLLSIRNGKIVMRFPFIESIRPGAIKVWARDAIGKSYRDNWLPDLDVLDLSVELELTPVLLDGQQIGYSGVSARTHVNLDGAGNSIERDMESALASKIESSFIQAFNHAEIKTMFAKKFTEKVRRYLDNRFWWVGVRGEGNTLVLTHR